MPVEIEFPGGVVTVWVQGGEFILDAARRHGYTLPSMCRQGWCTTCAMRVSAGDVDQSAARRYYDADRAAGFALICTARPRTPVRLIAGQHAAMREHRLRHGLPVPRG
jgi:ferredoxin